MSSVVGALDCPLDALRGIIRALIDEVNNFAIERIVVPCDGTLNSAMAAHVAFQATKHCGAELRLSWGSPYDIPGTETIQCDALKRAENVASLYSGIERPARLPEIEAQYAVQRAKSLEATMIAGERGLVIDLRDLTDYFIGTPKPSADEYPLFKWLLKTEMEKLGKTIVDWIGANPEEGESEKTTKARQSAIDNCIVQQENPGPMDYVLAVILAAKETNCEVLFNAHKEHAIVAPFKATRRIRGIENFDYNSHRRRFLGQE